jgi:hypothetical protein
MRHGSSRIQQETDFAKDIWRIYLGAPTVPVPLGQRRLLPRQADLVRAGLAPPSLSGVSPHAADDFGTRCRWARGSSVYVSFWRRWEAQQRGMPPVISSVWPFKVTCCGAVAWVSWKNDAFKHLQARRFDLCLRITFIRAWRVLLRPL